MNTYPMFRLALFLSAGIFFADTFRWEAGWGPVAALLVLLVVLGLRLRSHSYAYRWVYGVGVSCFMFLVGWVLTGKAWGDVKVEWPAERQVYRGVVKERPVEKKRTYQCRVEVADRDILLYLPKDSASASLGVADELLFEARIDSPKEENDSLDFDYATYLYHHGISGTAYVPAYAWLNKGQVKDKSWKQEALLVRERLLDKFQAWGVEAERMPVLAALTLGHKGDLDKETRTSFSVAGVSHVLALSGMHIGVIWFLLEGLMRLLMRRRFGWLRWLIVTSILWIFAFVVGLEASVVRAVVMCMLMGLGSLSGSRPLSINTLMLAAFFMLFYRPFYLFDVGFQLSFVAVASILLIHPMIFGQWKVYHRLGRWVWGTLSVSLAAQLGTAPLVMYYFSVFSVYFLFTNLVVAMLVPLIIYASLLMVMLAPLPMVQMWMVKVVNGLVGALDAMAAWVSGWPYASFSLAVLTPAEIITFYVVLACGLTYVRTQKTKWIFRLLFGIVCLLALHLYALWKG